MRQRGAFLINIDHHPKSDYGDINIGGSWAASTSLILYNILKIWQVKIDSEMATSFLAGILFDTGSFSNSSTNTEVISVAEELIRLGAKYGKINQALYRKDKNWLSFWALLLSRLQKNDKLKVAYSVVLNEDAGRKDGGGESIANFFNYLNEVRLVMILKEMTDGTIKVSLRTPDRSVDLNRLAKFFGGGGHRQAAGFIIEGRLERERDYWRII